MKRAAAFGMMALLLVGTVSVPATVKADEAVTEVTTAEETTAEETTAEETTAEEVATEEIATEEAATEEAQTEDVQATEDAMDVSAAAEAEETAEEEALTGASDAVIDTAGIYAASQDGNGVLAGMVTSVTGSGDLEYRWLSYDIKAGKWSVYQDWTLNSQWVQYNPGTYGDYLLQGEVRPAGNEGAVKTDCIGVNHHPNIKGKCQMPYTGEGGGYLIGVESYDNPNNAYSYELLVLDCSKYAAGDPNPWIYSSGQKKVSGNAFWTVLQPEFGYYWTLFRVYDENGVMVDEDCYGFENTVLPKDESQIASVPYDQNAIEADVTLSGAGTGYHAKLVMATPTSAVSYGIQYDACAAAPYTGKAMAMIENVSSNAAGGQNYDRPGNRELAVGQTYHLMMTLDQEGYGAVYLDNEQIGTFYNPNLARQDLAFRVEASGRKNGDQVNVSFKNIKLKKGMSNYSKHAWGTHEFKTNATLNLIQNGVDDITFTGYISGLGAGDDWDNRYGDVSDIIQYIY